VFTAVTTKNAVNLDVTPCSSCKNNVSEELIPSIERVKRITGLGTKLAVYRAEDRRLLGCFPDDNNDECLLRYYDV
jgi:hypothetical protein